MSTITDKFSGSKKYLKYYYATFIAKINKSFDPSENISNIENLLGSNQKFNLYLQKTNIEKSNSNLLKLKDFLIKKVSNITVLEKEIKSAITTVDLWDQEDYNCYYGYYHSSENDLAVVCFLTHFDIKLDLFQDDIDLYIMKYLKDDLNSHDFTNWSDICLQYTCRCINILGKNLQYLIFAVCTDHIVKAIGPNTELCYEIERFSKSISVQNLFPIQETDDLCKISRLFEININNENESVTQFKETTKFCKEWALMMSVESVVWSPSRIKMIINNFKTKIAHDLNKLNRYLKVAQVDYYSLYKCLTFIRESDNASVLLHLVNEQNKDNEDSCNILTLLQNFL